jgi:large subunit ribosomal protein L17
MRHLKHRHQLGRKKEHRIALMANLASALLRHGRIQTTLAKAKALRPFVEKIITLAVHAKSASPERALHLRRQAISKIRDKNAVQTLFNERVSEFTDRPGGYTRIYKLGNRIGDAAEMAVIQLIPGSDTGYESRKASSGKSAKPAAVAPVAEAAEAPVAEAEIGTEEEVEVAVEEAPSETEVKAEESAPGEEENKETK